MMDVEAFWKVIEAARAKGGIDMDARCEALAAELRKLPREEIIAYSHRFSALQAAAYTWELWGAAYTMQGGCGDDSFSDFRSSLISMGQQIFQSAVANPDSLADLSDDEAECLYFEGFQYVDSEVFKELFDDEIPVPDVQRVDDPVGDEWDFDDEDEVKKRLPRLYRKYFAI